MARYRSRSRILLDLLHSLESPHSVTALLRDVNLSHPRLREYLGQLEEKGWAEQGTDGWRVTDGGREVRTGLDRLAQQMADFGLEL